MPTSSKMQSPRAPLIKGWNPPTVKPPKPKVSLREQTRNKGAGKQKPGALRPKSRGV